MSTTKIGPNARRNASALALLFVVGLGVFSLRLPAPALGRRVAQVASNRLGIALTEGRFRLSLLEGLVLEDGRAVAWTAGRGYRFELPRVVFEHRRLALLAGVLEVRALRFERPRIELVELEEEPRELAPSVSDDGEGLLSPRFDVAEVVLDDAAVRLGEASGGRPSSIEGVDVQLGEVTLREKEPGLLALDGSGSFTARSAHLGDLTLTDGRADLYLHEGQVSLTLLRFRSALAPFVAELRVDLERSPFGYDVSALGEPFDAAPLVGAPAGSLGTSSLLIEVFGRGPAPAGFRAQGSLSLSERDVGEAPVLEALNGALGRDVFRSTDRLRETLVVYRVRDGYVLFEPFELASTVAVATIRGRAYLDGRLELQVEVRTPELSATTLAVTGTVDHPTARAVP